jgi:hypothetical protein
MWDLKGFTEWCGEFDLFTTLADPRRGAKENLPLPIMGEVNSIKNYSLKS